MLGKSEANCRQILSRARRRIGDERPRFDADPEQRHTLAARFLAAAREGDMEGPRRRARARRGARRRRRRQGARAAAAAGRRRADRPRLRGASPGWPPEWGVTLEPALVNGQPGVRAIAPDGGLVNVLSIDVDDGAVQRIHSMLNPDKLGHLGPLSDVALRPAVR